MFDFFVAGLSGEYGKFRLEDGNREIQPGASALQERGAEASQKSFRCHKKGAREHSFLH